MKKLLLAILLFSLSKNYAQVGLDDAITVAKELAKEIKNKNFQPKWIQTSEIGISLPSKITTNYGSVFKNEATYEQYKNLLREDSELSSKLSYNINYSINYPILRRLTLGAVAEYQFQTQASLSTLHIGPVFRYYFKSYEGPNVYGATSYNITLSNKLKSAMGNVRLGIQFPVQKHIDKNLTLNIFWYSNMYQMSKNQLQNFEVSGNYNFKGYGINLGYQF